MRNVKNLLSDILNKYNRCFLPEDPVSLVHIYSRPEDQEVVGFLAALLAFGNAKTIIASTQKILTTIKEPCDFIKNFNPEKEAKLFSTFRHRWISNHDLVLLLAVIQKAMKEYGSLENMMVNGLDHFSKTMKKFAGFSTSRGFNYFFPSPLDGSPCKRLNMFLRWMVRPADGIDLGLWKKISPSQLIIPLDTHVYQFAKAFKISRYKNPSWQMALDVTQFLKKFDPKDPIKYDFAICHYGMKEGWLYPPPKRPAPATISE